MCERLVYYGDINNRKKDEFINISIEYLKKNKGDKFYYILPTGNLLTRYREVLLSELKGVFDINVITFDDIVMKLLKNDNYIKIDDCTKETIIASIIDKLYKDGLIDYYKDLIHMEGFIKSVSYIIGEIKRSLVSPEKFIDNIPDNLRYIEIGRIYKLYQDFLHDKKLIDNEEAFINAFNKLRNKNDYFADLDFIIIDEFFDFRPQEFKLLEEMSKSNIDIYINIPYKTTQNFKTVNDTLEALRKIGFEIRILTEKKDSTYFEKLSDKLFLGKKGLLEGNDNIFVIKASNQYLEIKRICQEIKELSQNGINLDDIGLVIGNEEFYIDIVREVFNEEGVPSTLGRDIRVIDVPLIQEIINILEARLSNFSKEDLVKGINSGYLNICEDIRKDKFQYILHNFNKQGNSKELKKAFNKARLKYRHLIKINPQDKELYEEKLEDIANVEFIIDDFTGKLNEIPINGSCIDIVEALKRVIDYYDLSKNIQKNYSILKDYSILQRDVDAYSAFMSILDKIILTSKLVYDGEIRLKDFYEMFIRFASDIKIKAEYGNPTGVNIFTPSSIRGMSLNTVFIVGLAQGVYPSVIKDNWFFREKDYKLFRKIGIDVKTYEETLDKEMLLFLVALTRATNSLVLSYCESMGGDESKIPSVFLDEVVNLFKEDSLNIINIDNDYMIKDDLRDITTKNDMINHLLYKCYSEDEISKYIGALKNIDENILDEIDLRLECEVKRNDDSFNEYDGLINDREIIEDINNLYKDCKYSITQLELFGKCPFRFLYESVLGINGIEKKYEEFSPLNRGIIYHEVLAKYYSNHAEDMRKHILDGKDFPIKDTKNEIKQLIKKALNKIDVFKDTQLWSLRIEHIADTILNLVKIDMERLKNYSSKPIPVEFEIEFGREDEFSLKLGQKKVQIQGKIDRIDSINEGEKYILYDYKNSSFGKNTIKDIEKGLSFQLPVYILSQINKDRDVIGAGYIVIKDGEASIEIIKDEDKKLLNKRKGKTVLNDENWKALLEHVKNEVFDYIEKISNGEFRLKPILCDSFCQYSTICRYNAERISRKDDDCGIN